MAPRIRITDATMRVLLMFLSSPTEEFSGADFVNQIRIFSGTLYPILQRLEKAKWLESRWEDTAPEELGRPRRKYYRLTKLGQQSADAELRARGILGESDFSIGRGLPA